jgi:hypothetical protein
VAHNVSGTPAAPAPPHEIATIAQSLREMDARRGIGPRVAGEGAGTVPA